jgi:two-component system CheB/CheR fusion protein
LRRFFIKEEEHRYRVTKTIRDLCVFARHDVTRDPPFSRLDLISCRNLLIYFDRNLQNHLVRMFHYSLKANGFLVLGPSETAGRTDLFRLSEGRRQIYRRQPASGGRAPASLAVEGRDRPTTPDTVRPRTRNRSRASDLKRKPSVCS